MTGGPCASTCHNEIYSLHKYNSDHPSGKICFLFDRLGSDSGEIFSGWFTNIIKLPGILNLIYIIIIAIT